MKEGEGKGPKYRSKKGGSPQGQEEGLGSYTCVICFPQRRGKLRDAEERERERGRVRRKEGVYTGLDEPASQTSYGFRVSELCKSFLIRIRIFPSRKKHRFA